MIFCIDGVNIFRVKGQKYILMHSAHFNIQRSEYNKYLTFLCDHIVSRDQLTNFQTKFYKY